VVAYSIANHFSQLFEAILDFGFWSPALLYHFYQIGQPEGLKSEF
jgi:hypothetical protein